MKSKQLRTIAYALSAALVWGMAFSFQRIVSESMGPLTFNFLRSLLAAAALGALLPLLRRGRKESLFSGDRGRRLLTGGLVTGALMFVASNLQQLGIAGTEAGKAGFLTALYIVLVPLLGALFWRRRFPSALWISVLVAAVGLYLISVRQGFTISRSDATVIVSAVAYAVYILAVDHYVAGVEPVAMSCAHFLVCGVLSGIGAFVFEHPAWEAVSRCLWPLLYLGVISGAVGYTLEFSAHQLGNPVTVSVLLSMESVFSVLGGAVLLGERLTPRELLGCGVMFCAVLLAQLPVKSEIAE